MLRKITFLILISFAAPAFIAGCGGYEEPEQGPIKRAPRPEPKAEVEAPEPVKRDFREILAAKQRNPFQSFIIQMRGEEGPKKIKGPLECCELDAFRVQAVVVAGDNSYALVLAPDGKRYIIRPGDVMGVREGRVIDINSTAVVVREFNRSSTGEILSRVDVELKLPTPRKPLMR
jgi:Tfp pilus assembly protein PilP